MQANARVPHAGGILNIQVVHTTGTKVLKAHLITSGRQLAPQQLPLSSPAHIVPLQKALAFWKRRSQGAVLVLHQSGGIHGHCHGRKARSGCGIMARWRPSSEQSAAMPCGEPLGLCG
mmetsp:Transcript_10353/g.17364  ORF Transcript_10353/g.17364 Transcript_10353/m.17364 type:complete len:118 (+) Transcript_10353:180-533(+)